MMTRFFSPSALRKTALWAGGIVAAVAVTGFLIIPAVLRPKERSRSERLVAVQLQGLQA